MASIQHGDAVNCQGYNQFYFNVVPIGTALVTHGGIV